MCEVQFGNSLFSTITDLQSVLTQILQLNTTKGKNE